MTASHARVNVMDAHGFARVRGYVRVLEPAQGEEPAVGAVIRTVRPENDAHEGIIEQRVVGRFLVEDETGAAALEGAVDVWLAEEPDSTGQGWSLEVRDGAMVELIGPCETNAERERQATSVYRTGPEVVTFVTRGRDRPLLLLTRRGVTS